MCKFSVLMSVYKNSAASEFAECFASLEKQTVKAAEYVLVLDGSISGDLELLIDGISAENANFKAIRLPENVGLGLALREGMKHCEHELIARMDTDDIAEETRFEKQLKYFEDDALSIVGSDIAEFTESTENVVSIRRVPETHEEICDYMKKRCPFNHMTVMFKKSEVEKAGGYLEWHYNEDSYLWLRMYLAGCKFRNIKENLVFARINGETFKRRGGCKYYKSEKKLLRYMRKNKIIGAAAYAVAVWIRMIVYLIMPNRIRQWFFMRYMRKNHENDMIKEHLGNNE